jgi:hypothetical protein
MCRHSVFLVISIEIKIINQKASIFSVLNPFELYSKLFLVFTMPSPAHPGPLTLEVAAVQAKVDDDALTKAIEAAKRAIRSSGRLLIETKKVQLNKAVKQLGIASIFSISLRRSMCPMLHSFYFYGDY